MNEGAGGKRLIGISAKIGCGKTVMAQHIMAKQQFVKGSFGDFVKAECAAYTGLSIGHFYDPELKKTPVEVFFGTIIPRKFMQWWGTDFRRRSDPCYWVRYMEKLLAQHYVQGRFDVVIDDMRFLNEAEFVKQRNGFLVRIEPYEGYDEKYLNHQSETELDNYKGFDLCVRPAFGALDCAANIVLSQLAIRK